MLPGFKHIFLFMSIVILIGCSSKNETIVQYGQSHQQQNELPDSSSGLYALWSFQGDSDAELKDSSQYSLDGIIHGATRTVEDGHVALEFNGENNYVEMDAKKGENLEHLAKLGDGTISVWFKLSTVPIGKEIYPIFYYGSSSACDFFDAANKGMIIEVGHHPVQYNSKRLYFTIWANGCTYPSFCYDSNFALEANKWYHFVAVVGPDYNTGYLNGEEMTYRRYNFNTERASQFFENAVAHEALWIGRGYWDRQLNYFDGFIGDVRIYGDALSHHEVKKLYDEIQSK